jgi:hypothetical protein
MKVNCAIHGSSSIVVSLDRMLLAGCTTQQRLYTSDAVLRPQMQAIPGSERGACTLLHQARHVACMVQSSCCALLSTLCCGSRCFQACHMDSLGVAELFISMHVKLQQHSGRKACRDTLPLHVGTYVWLLCRQQLLAEHSWLERSFLECAALR